MNREVRYSKQGAAEVEQHRPGRGAIPERDPARDRQIPIEPGMEQQTAVGLDGELAVAVRRDVRARLEPQVRRVRVRPDDPKATARRRFRADLEGDQAAASPDREAAISRRQLPDLVFAQEPVARRPKTPHGLRNRVVGRGGRVDERDQVAHELRHPGEGSGVRASRQAPRPRPSEARAARERSR